MPALRQVPNTISRPLRRKNAAHGVVWRYPGTSARLRSSRRSFNTLQKSRATFSDDLPYVFLEEGFSRWSEHQPLVHDCIVNVAVQGNLTKTDSFLVSGYHNPDKYPRNPIIDDVFPEVACWHGEVVVVFLGKRRYFKKGARMSQTRKAAAAFMDEIYWHIQNGSDAPSSLKTF